MANFTNAQVEIFNGSDVSQGTIAANRILDFGNESLVDGIGKGFFVIALDDTKSLDIISRNRIAQITLDTTTTTNIVASTFIIHNIEKNLMANGRAVAVVSGPDMLYEWTYNNLGYTVIDDGAGGEKTAILVHLITTHDPGIGGGWTLYGAGTVANQTDGYHVPSGETVWQAITQLSPPRDMHNSYIQKDTVTTTVPCRRIFQQGGFTIESKSSPGTIIDKMSLKLSPSIASEVPIIDGTFQIINEPTEVVTRVYVYGAGKGNDRFTIADKTDADPTGFTSTAADSLIVNTALEAITDQPQITRVTHFSSIKPEDPDDATMKVTAANQLLQAGVSYLGDRDGSTRVFYEMETFPDGQHVAGQLVTLTYSRTSPYDTAGAENDTVIINITGTFALLKYDTFLDQNKNWRARVVLSEVEVGQAPELGDDLTANKILKLEEVVRHSTSGSSRATAPDGADSYLRAAGSPPNLTGNMVVDAGITIDGVDISAANAETFVMISASSEHANERTLASANGMGTLADGGAGGTVSIPLGTPGSVTSSSTNAVTASSHTHAIDSTVAGSSITLTAGEGLTGGGDWTANRTVDMGTPATLTAATANGTTASSHTHAITASADPGTAASLLKTDASGHIILDQVTIDTKLYINETANTKLTTGITINQGTADDEILSFKSSDVSHGVTTDTEDDTYGYISKASPTIGGIAIFGFSGSTAGIVTVGVATTEITTDTSGSNGANLSIGYLKSGTTLGQLGATGNTHAWRNGTDTTMLLKGNGDLHIVNTTLTALDGYDDIALMRAMQIEMSGGRGIRPLPIDKGIVYNRSDLERAGMIAGDFMATQGAINGLLGAFVQLGSRVMALEEQLGNA